MKQITGQSFFALLRLFGKYLLFLLAFVCLLTNCRTETVNPQVNAPTREIVDGLGRTVKLPETVERAVSLAPNLTEIVFAVGAGDKLVGRTSYDNFPIEAQKIQIIGDTLNPNIENIIGLKPQIVLVSTASQIETFTKQLESQNITIFVTNPNSFDDIYKTISQIGEIFGKNERAREIIFGLKNRVAQTEANINPAKKVKVFLQISKEPLFTIGEESFLTDLIERAGGISVTANVATAYPKLSKETALVLNPEVIILSESEDNLEPNEVFKNSPAARSGKVFKINADIISRPSPRIVDALEQIARDLQK
ncbi:MAG: cobalamin-binding protein [Acidobacteriota bacterium]|nr:cobalamin-binding protein [Acidobacteriota bacterium]